MPQTHVWTAVVGLCWRLRKGVSLYRACCASCRDLGCIRGDEEAPSPSSCPSALLTAQKPGLDVPWSLSTGWLMLCSLMRVAPLDSGTERPPGRGQGSGTAVGSIQHLESSTSIKDTPGPAGLHILVRFVGKPGAGPGQVGGEVACPARLLCWECLLCWPLAWGILALGEQDGESEDDRVVGKPPTLLQLHCSGVGGELSSRKLLLGLVLCGSCQVWLFLPDPFLPHTGTHKPCCCSSSRSLLPLPDPTPGCKDKSPGSWSGLTGAKQGALGCTG